MAVVDAPYLKLTDGLLHFEKAGRHLFFVPDIPDWIVVNKNAALLLFSCNGTISEEAIARSFDLPALLREKMQLLFLEALRRGVLKQEGIEFKPAWQTRSASSCSGDRRRTLRSVYLKLTDECNLRCKYCYANSGKPSDSLSLEVLRRILQEVSEISAPVEFVLSGGEPLLHPHALDFAEEAAKEGHSVQLLTNGTLIDSDEIAHRIAKATKLVKLSLDGITPEVHSKSRGKGNFERVTKAVELLERRNANVLVAMTVTKQNVHEIAPMSARYGSRLTLQPLFIAGRGKRRTNIALTGEEYYRAMDAVSGVAPMGNVSSVLESIRGRGVKKCALADREISISETGDVFPCQLLHAPEFLAGNIHESKLGDIYAQSPTLRKLQSLNVDTLDKCSTCPIRLICAGGCRARDYYEGGSVEAVGEFCEYEKLAFINGILDYSYFSP